MKAESSHFLTIFLLKLLRKHGKQGFKSLTVVAAPKFRTRIRYV